MTKQNHFMPMTKANRPRTPMRTRLMTGGAMAACLTALVSHAPAQAFSSAFQGIANVVNPGTATVSQNPGVDVITVTAPQAVINWTPNDRGSSGTIDFLPFGSTGRFIGTQEFTVLNRIIPLDGNDLPIARLIALNGIIESLILDPLSGATTRGGSVWFYSPGGILVGSSATINVGNLVLSARDIDTTGGLFGSNGEIRFRDPTIAGTSTSAITIDPGAQIFASRATGANSYIAMVAPRIEQRGVVQADGSVALVAAERANLRINAGLFDINVLVGTEDTNGIVHTGTTGGILDAAGGHAAYLVAVPKNQAMTMLLSGVVGFVPGQAAGVNAQGNIVISAGRNASGTIVGGVVNGNSTGSMRISDTRFLNQVVGGATNDIAIRPEGDCAPFCSPFGLFGQVQFRANATFTADRSLSMSVGNAQQIVADQNLILRAGVGGTGGTVSLAVDNAPPSSPSSTGGGVISVTGLLLLDASAIGDPMVADGLATGGMASVNVINGELSASSLIVRSDAEGGSNMAGNGALGEAGTASVTAGAGGLINTTTLTVQANGAGRDSFSDTGGNGRGGTARVSAIDGGVILASQLLEIQATGSGILGATRSGDGLGGLAELIIGAGQSSVGAGQTVLNASGIAGNDAGNINLSSTPETMIGGTGIGGIARISSSGDANLGSVFISAVGDGSGSLAPESAAAGTGGDGTGGTVEIAINGGLTRAGLLSIDASAFAGNSGNVAGTTGTATGGSISISVANGALLNNRSGANLQANAVIDTRGGGAVQEALGGNIFVGTFSGGEISSSSTWTLIANANAEVGRDESAVRTAASATGGTISLLASDSGAFNVSSLLVRANAVAAHAAGTGGNATGGTIRLTAESGGSIDPDDDDSRFEANGAAGSGLIGGTGTGGNIEFLVDGGEMEFYVTTLVDAVGLGGQSFDGINLGNGRGGNVSIRLTDNADSRLILGDLFVSTGAGTATGGEGFVNLGDGAVANGGSINVLIEGGIFEADSVALDASADGNGRGGGFGGSVSFVQTGGVANIQFLGLLANGLSNNFLFGPRGGTGTGGEVNLDLTGGQLTSDFLSMSAEGRGGDGLSAFSNAIFTGGEGPPPIVFDIYGGFDGNIVTGQYNAPSDGGDGFGGTVRVRIGGDAVLAINTEFGFQAFASGIGGEGGDAFADPLTSPTAPGIGGRGAGGTIEFIYESGEIRGAGSQPPALVFIANGIGGDGGRLNFNAEIDCQFFDCSNLPDDPFTLPTAVDGPRGGDGTGGEVRATLLGALDNALLILDSSGFGGGGGEGLTGGRGGEGRGGSSTLFVDNVDGGTSDIQLISEGRGGFGAHGINGEGGDGGQGIGGRASLLLSGLDALLDSDNVEFQVNGFGGRGGDGRISPFAATIPMIGPRGGNGGEGFGGSIELDAINTNLLIGMSGEGADLESRGIGGNAGDGADNSSGPSGEARFGGNAGFAGAGFGGTVTLRATGGTISIFQNRDLNINVTGTGGEGGFGGAGNTITLFDMMGNPVGTSGGSGFSTGQSFTFAGTIRLEASDDGENLGLIQLGRATLTANGDIAGRIELIDNSMGSGLTFDTLDAQALGSPATSSDFALAGSGIYISSRDGGIFVDDAATLDTNGMVQVDAVGTGGLIVDRNLRIFAERGLVARHDALDENSATIRAQFIDAVAGFVDFRAGSRIATSFGSRIESFSTIDFDMMTNGSSSIQLFAVGNITGQEIDTPGSILFESQNGNIAVGDIDAESGIALLAGNGNVSGDRASSDVGSILIDADSVNYGSIFAGGEGGIRIIAVGDVTLDRAVTEDNEDVFESGVQGQLAVTPGDFDIFISAGGDVSFNEISALDSVFISASSITAAGSSLFGNAGISVNTVGNAELGDLETVFGDMDIRAGNLLTAESARIGSSSAEAIFRGVNGVTIQMVRIPGEVEFTATNGAVQVFDLQSGLVTALGRTVNLISTDDIIIDSVEATAGDVVLTGASGDLFINTGRASGTFEATTFNGALSAGQLNAANIDLTSSSTATLSGAVTATSRLDVSSRDATTVNAAATGATIFFGSGDMVIGSNGRIGTVGTTTSLELRNTDNSARTFIGGNDQAGEYSLSSAEMARLFGNNILIRAPRVTAQQGDALGLTRPPDVVIGAFTFVGGGGTGANLGSSGTLRIETPGFARVVGAAQFNNMSTTNGFELDARDSIEIILGQGSIRLSGSGANGLGGTLSLFSDDIAVATASAITAIAGLTDLSAVDERLAQNDGVTSDDGALTANAIDIFVTNGVYIQNSGLSDSFDDRRGFTTNSLGINFAGSPTAGNSNLRIVINGRIGDSMNVLRTGIDAIALAVINDVSGGTAGGFDSLSTINGCVIANPASCSTPEIIFDNPIRDVIEEEVEDDDDSPGDGSEYQSLITIRENDRSREDPLLDEPVTGSGNDDLWIPAG